MTQHKNGVYGRVPPDNGEVLQTVGESFYRGGVPSRLPPTNVQAEQALLGAILANNRAYERVQDFLEPQHFADPINAKIYASLQRRIGRRELADAVTLKAEFENDNTLDAVGGAAYLAQLLCAMVGIINAGEYGRAVHDAWVRREMMAVAADVTDAACGSVESQTAAEILDMAERRLMQIGQGADDSDLPVSAAAMAKHTIAVGRAAMLRGTGIAGIASGYRGLDRLLSGLQDSTLMLLGARPSIGKTSVGLGVAARVASMGKKVLMWSGEMPDEQIGARLIAARCNLPITAVLSGYYPQAPGDSSQPTPLCEDDQRKIRHAGEEMEQLSLWVDCRPKLSVAQIRSKARRMKMKGGLDLLVIDYVGLLRASEQASRQGGYAIMTEISGALMELRSELKIPILALAQLNRASEGRDDKMPQMSDLRDSGALEQDANVVMLLHREHWHLVNTKLVRRDKESPNDFVQRGIEHQQRTQDAEGKATLLVPKNRQGPPGLIDMQFQDHTAWLRDDSEAPHSTAWGR